MQVAKRRRPTRLDSVTWIKSAAVMLVTLLAPASGIPQPEVCRSSGFSLQLGEEHSLLTTAQRAGLGLEFGPPDGTLGVLRLPEKSIFFAAARSGSQCAGTPLTQGTYRFGGDFSKITAPYECKALIQPGGDPNGYTFDRDYAGGGPVLPLSGEGGKLAVLHIYHGEWHGGVCSKTGVCFYASLGMALSRDGGNTFAKLGEIVQPAISRLESIDSGKNLDVGGGTPVIADQDGRYIRDLNAIDPSKVYLYIFYADKDPAAETGLCARTACIALARAKLCEVVRAAHDGNTARFPYLFKKYHQGRFDQPATSGDADAALPAGHYTPIVADAGDFPTVVYDDAVHQYLMAYTTGNDAIVLRRGESLLSWAPTAVGTISNPGESFVYTTLVGEGSDPMVSHGHPRLVYVHAPKWPDWPDAVVADRQIDLRYR
jgi:hypothetical protein